ncbi:MAG TPA: hypothetical protein VJR30_04845 [Bradyrhizobium sp.]|nr:hypothetical protein [Bradyrhizobium sp.]
MPYALFDRERQIGAALATEAAVWKQALEQGLIHDIPVADEAGGQVLPAGYHIKEIAAEQEFDSRSDWKLPRKIS